MIHRKILDIAEVNPDASLDAIASEVSGASVAFVKRVFEEYGDPANSSDQSGRTDGIEQNGHSESSLDEAKADMNGTDDRNGTDSGHDSESENADEPAESGEDGQAKANGEGAKAPSQSERVVDGLETGSDGIPDPSQLSEKQYETLLAVREQPTATQTEIGEELEVSRATVSKRLSDVPGFDWATRRQFVIELFDEQGGTEPVATEPDLGVDRETIAELTERVETLESKLERQQASVDDTGADLDLVQKVAHACLEYDEISPDEELQILREILPVDDRTDSTGGTN